MEKTGFEVVEGAAASDVLPDSDDIVHEQRKGKVSSDAADAVPASSAAAAAAASKGWSIGKGDSLESELETLMNRA